MDMTALTDEISEAATALTNYVNAVKRLHSVGGAGEIGKIDGVLDKAEEQLRRLRTAAQAIHVLTGLRSR